LVHQNEVAKNEKSFNRGLYSVESLSPVPKTRRIEKTKGAIRITGAELKNKL